MELSPPQRPLLVFIYKTLGPYHLPRLIHLAKEGRGSLEVRCIVIASKQEEYNWATEQSLEVENVDYISVITLFPGQSIDAVGAARQTRALINDMITHRPSLIFTAGYSHLPMLMSTIALRLLNIRSILMTDSNRFDRTRSRSSELPKRLIVRVFNGALAAGCHSRNYLIELGMRSEVIKTACDVVDNENVADHTEAIRRSVHGRSYYFLFVGRMIEEKNIPLLLRAYKIYLDRAAVLPARNLVLCGTGPLEENLKELVAKMGLSGVHFAGYVRHPEIYSYYAQAHALVLPSSQETWGLVVNEALAAGVPVLVSDACGCASDLISEDRTGWVFPSENAESLANLMFEVDQLDASKRSKMQKCCREHIKHWGLSRFSSGVLCLAGRLARIGQHSENK